MSSRRRTLQVLASLASLASLAVWSRRAAAQDLAWPAAQWESLTPSDSGWSLARLQEADAVAQRLGSDAVLVVHRGRVVYSRGETSKPFNLYSGRKSVLSVLLGMQADAGRLKLQASLAELGIDDKLGLTGLEKAATVEQLLQSRSGIYHPAAYETLDAMVSRPARGSHAPGTHWYYNNWDFNALGTVYRRVSGRTVFEGLQADLAEPLQMAHWRLGEHGTDVLERSSEHPAYVMQLSALDFARIGLLLARGGQWRGRRLLSDAWLKQSTRVHSEVPPGWSGYGYMWWVPLRAFDFWTRSAPGDVFFASGNHGQLLWVDRARDIVVVHGTDHTRWLRVSPQLGQLAPLLDRIFAAMPT